MLDVAVIEPKPAAPPAALIATERFKCLVTGYYRFVWRSLQHLGVADADLDDAAQQVFMVVGKKLESVALGHERSFLYGTAVRIAHRSRRSRQRRREVPAVSGHVHVDPAPGPDELVDRAQARQLLDGILEAMDLECRTVFVLFEIEQLTAPEIAEALEIPVGTVASRLRRARAELRAQVLRYQASGHRGGRP